jgi:antitoxin PrlF
MSTTLTRKGQVTIPKRIRDALGLVPGSRVAFDVDDEGRIFIRREKAPRRPGPSRFARARGRATVKWRTDDLMRLLRDEPA